MNIELQVGNRYETRGGLWIAEITGRDEAEAGTDNEFSGCVEFGDGDRHGGRSWRADGRFSSDMESVSDLIRELPDASSTPEPEPVSDTQASLTATEGPATEKVVVHWDRERFIGIEADASTSAGADDAWLRANLAETRANIARKYAQAAAYLLLGVAAVIFAIGTSVQA